MKDRSGEVWSIRVQALGIAFEELYLILHPSSTEGWVWTLELLSGEVSQFPAIVLDHGGCKRLA